jgi:MerR family copper efflux transcriptional regulator
VEAVARLRKIGQLKKLGLSRDEIGEVIDLYFMDPSGVQPKQKVLSILRSHLAETD